MQTWKANRKHPKVINAEGLGRETVNVAADVEVLAVDTQTPGKGASFAHTFPLLSSKANFDQDT